MVYNYGYVRTEGIMTTSDLVRQLCEKENISISELARRIGQSRQNFTKKLRRDTLCFDELAAIAEVTGATFEQSFTLPDGEKIKIGSWRRNC